MVTLSALKLILSLIPLTNNGHLITIISRLIETDTLI